MRTAQCSFDVFCQITCNMYLPRALLCNYTIINYLFIIYNCNDILIQYYLINNLLSIHLYTVCRNVI